MACAPRLRAVAAHRRAIYDIKDAIGPRKPNLELKSCSDARWASSLTKSKWTSSRCRCVVDAYTQAKIGDAPRFVSRSAVRSLRITRFRFHVYMPTRCSLFIALFLSMSGISDAQETVAVSGAVVDQIGAVVAGAHVDLTTGDGTLVQAGWTDPQGNFTFPGVPPGSYVVTVNIVGFTPFATSQFAVEAGSRPSALPPIVLTVESVSTTVIVRSTEAIAEEQIKAEEQQRLLGFIPSFYVSYVADAAPLTSRQKFALAVHDTFDWTAYIGDSVAAAIDQATHAHPAFGGGGSGYAKRWAANFADDRTGDLLTHYVFASLFHQDPRYFCQGTGTTQSRLVHALASAFVARSDRGTTMPNYAYLFGNIGAAAVSNTYYPHVERGADLILANVAIGLAGRAAVAVTQEFLGKRLTKNVPTGP